MNGTLRPWSLFSVFCSYGLLSVVIEGNTLTTGTSNVALVQWSGVIPSIFINFILILIRRLAMNSLGYVLPKVLHFLLGRWRTTVAFFLHVNVLSMAGANVSPIGSEERRAYGREDAVHKENAYLGEMRSEDSTGSRGALACFIQFFGFKIGLHLSFCFSGS